MTSSIKVQSHNHPVLVQALDREPESHQFEEHAYETAPDGKYKLAWEQILKPEDGIKEFHCTTTRIIRCTDLEYDDPRVPVAKPVEAA